MTASRDDIQEALEGHLDSMQYTYNQHFAVANFNRWLGRFIDFAIFAISSIVVVTKIMATLGDIALILLLLVTAGLSAVHRATKPGEHESEFRESAHEYQDLFKRGRSFILLDLHSDELTDEEAREQYDELFEEYLELNQNSPDASSFWYRYMKYVKGEEQMEEEIATTESKRRVLSADD